MATNFGQAIQSGQKLAANEMEMEEERERIRRTVALREIVKKSKYGKQPMAPSTPVVSEQEAGPTTFGEKEEAVTKGTTLPAGTQPQGQSPKYRMPAFNFIKAQEMLVDKGMADEAQKIEAIKQQFEANHEKEIAAIFKQDPDEALKIYNEGYFGQTYGIKLDPAKALNGKKVYTIGGNAAIAVWPKEDGTLGTDVLWEKDGASKRNYFFKSFWGNRSLTATERVADMHARHIFETTGRKLAPLEAIKSAKRAMGDVTEESLKKNLASTAETLGIESKDIPSFVERGTVSQLYSDRADFKLATPEDYGILGMLGKDRSFNGMSLQEPIFEEEEITGRDGETRKVVRRSYPLIDSYTGRPVTKIVDGEEVQEAVKLPYNYDLSSWGGPTGEEREQGFIGDEDTGKNADDLDDAWYKTLFGEEMLQFIGPAEGSESANILAGQEQE